MIFQTERGLPIPAVTAEQMRDIDRIAVEEFNLGILQMMENAGRGLAYHVMDMLGASGGEVAVLAGGGGNGGGGLCCARHLHNRGFEVRLVLDQDGENLTGPAGIQLSILRAAGVLPTETSQVEAALRGAQVVVDALIGYGLRDRPAGYTAQLIDLCNQLARLVLSNDIPSGVNATTGDRPGPAVRADRILTLAAPKTGLQRLQGELCLADIGIPPEVFHRLGLPFQPPFDKADWVRLTGSLS